MQHINNNHKSNSNEKKRMRDVIAFWIFGLANNFAYVIMLSAAEDIIHQEEGRGGEYHLNTIGNATEHICLEVLDKPRCKEKISTGAILLADILPALFVKFTFPFFMNRLPFGFRHFLVCTFQALSYLIVAFSTSIEISLLGVVFAAFGSGLGEICYLALCSHYNKISIAAWSSGTGAAGLVGALVYAVLTEPKLIGATPKTALLCQLIVPLIFAITYWNLLTPAPTVHKMSITDPATWIVPAEKKPFSSIRSSSGRKNKSKSESASEKEKASTASTARSNGIDGAVENGTVHRHSELETIPEKASEVSEEEMPEEASETGTDEQNSAEECRPENDGESGEKKEKPALSSESSSGIKEEKRAAFTHEFSFATKCRLVMPLLRYMIPLSFVYFAEYLINSGLHQLLQFDCAHGFWLDRDSQFRWYMALYQFGVFTSRSLVFLLVLPRWALYTMPLMQCANLAVFYMQAVHRFIPHIGIIFVLTYVEGIFGGASYANTFHRIHKEAPVEVREFSMSIASSGDSIGISLSGFFSILLHNFVCDLYPSVYPMSPIV